MWLRFLRVRSFSLCLFHIYRKSFKSQYGSVKNALKDFNNLLDLSVKDLRDYSWTELPGKMPREITSGWCLVLSGEHKIIYSCGGQCVPLVPAT